VKEDKKPTESVKPKESETPKKVETPAIEKSKEETTPNKLQQKDVVKNLVTIHKVKEMILVKLAIKETRKASWTQRHCMANPEVEQMVRGLVYPCRAGSGPTYRRFRNCQIMKAEELSLRLNAMKMVTLRK